MIAAKIFALLVVAAILYFVIEDWEQGGWP